MSARAFVCTSYDLTLVERFERLVARGKARFVCGQRETCPETGRVHVQFYVEFTREKSVTAVKSLLGDDTCHLEKRRGTQAEAINYVTKEDTRQSPPISIRRAWTSRTRYGYGEFSF